jgi:hypothetical protein
MGLWRATISGTFYDQVCQNVLHFHAADAPNQGEALTIELRDHWMIEMQSCQNQNFSWRRIAVQDITTSGNPVLVTDIAPIAGILTGAGAHPSLAVVFSLRTAIPTKAGRGRFYMPGVHGQSILNGRVEPNAQIVFNGAATNLLARYGPSASSAFSLKVVPRSDPSAHKQVINILARGVFGIQRKRNIGVGI